MALKSFGCFRECIETLLSLHKLVERVESEHHKSEGSVTTAAASKRIHLKVHTNPEVECHCEFNI